MKYLDTVTRVNRLNELSDKEYELKVAKELGYFAIVEKGDKNPISLFVGSTIDEIDSFLVGLIYYIKTDGSSLYHKRANQVK